MKHFFKIKKFLLEIENSKKKSKAFEIKNSKNFF